MVLSMPEVVRSMVYLRTTDGEMHEVEEEIVMLSPMISRQVQSGKGSSLKCAILLPQCVTSEMLALVLKFQGFIEVSNNRKGKEYFVDRNTLDELKSVADSLELKDLSDFMLQLLGKTPEELDTMFQLPDDLTKEKSKPLRNRGADVRTRLLYKLERMKELKEEETQKSVEVEKKPVDDRPIDELVKYIEKGSKKKKKKNRKKKNQLKDTCESQICKKPDDDHDDELDHDNHDDELNHDDHYDELDHDDHYDELDPEMEKQIDNEVRAFEKRLSVPYTEILDEILASQKRRYSIRTYSRD